MSRHNSDISEAAIKRAAVKHFGQSVETSAPYWVDHERVRVGIFLNGITFGADFYFYEGVFR